ncbi:MAG: PTS sugar transporter subunit IIA [Chthoniobacterales bacterium]
MAIVLPDVINEKNMTLTLRARAATGAIREIIGMLKANGELGNSEKFIDEVIAREEASSTATEHGTAFPHARTDQVNRIALGIGRSSGGIRFGKGAQLVHLVFVIGVPRRMINDYLVCVGALARIVRNDSARAALLAAETPHEFAELLRSESLLLE